MTRVIGTCRQCGMIKAVKLSDKPMVLNRREGICEECEDRMPRKRDPLVVRYKQADLRKTKRARKR